MLSNKAAPTSAFRNVALSLKGKLLMGFLPNPSSGFMERFGNPPIPSVIALIPPLGDDPSFQVHNNSYIFTTSFRLVLLIIINYFRLCTMIQQY